MKTILTLATLILIQTSYSQIAVLSDLSFDRTLLPGESAKGTIQVRNETNEPQQAKVYQTDYVFNSDGANFYGIPPAHARSNAQWITYSPSLLTLAPHSTGTVTYVITIPKYAGSFPIDGTYWSVLMVEGLGKDSEESTLPGRKRQKEMKISQTMRYAVQLSTTIPNSGKKEIDILRTELVKKDHRSSELLVDVKNTGTVFLRPECYAEVYSLDGIKCGKFFGTKYRLYPNTSIRNAIDLSTLSSGKYKAIIVVDAGGDDIYGTEYELEI